MLALFSLVLAAAAIALPTAEVHQQAEARSAEADDVLIARFRGRFTDGGIPTEDVQAIPLGEHDLRFVLTVAVDEVLEGQLFEPWGEIVRFAVHSPSRFFALQGVRLPESRHHPDGVFVFELRRSKEETEPFRLELTAVDR